MVFKKKADELHHPAARCRRFRFGPDIANDEEFRQIHVHFPKLILFARTAADYLKADLREQWETIFLGLRIFTDIIPLKI